MSGRMNAAVISALAPKRNTITFLGNVTQHSHILKLKIKDVI
jgi:hypothetical protein